MDVARQLYNVRSSQLADFVRQHVNLYVPVKTIPVYNRQGDQAAEEIFDLTNNPSRETERAELYGHQRSVSVGDVIQVGQQRFLCMSTGWREI